MTDATEKAKATAAEHGVDLDTVTGTGTGGRITVADVLAAMETKPESTPEPEPEAYAPERIKVRQLISEAGVGFVHDTGDIYYCPSREAHRKVASGAVEFVDLEAL